MDSYDYVVIGGGSSGCIVAAELADSGASVLLLEAGPHAEEHPETLRADGYKDAFANDALIWERFSDPQRVFMGSGSVLGGSGSVNGMVYTRGAKQDYAEWPAGWQWDDVCDDFAAIEKRLRLNRREATAWTEACISSARACGFEERADLNDGELANVIGYEWMSYEDNQRRSSYVAFIRDAPDRPNLHIRTGALVHRILFKERRAVAVAYECAGELQQAAVAREVVLCAGALETPKLLMLSGVGPADVLRNAGVALVHNARGIGENLHDHPNVPVFFRTTRDVDCYHPQLYSFFRTNPSSALPEGQSDTCYVFWPAPSAMKEATQRMLPTKLPARLYGSPLRGLLRKGVGWAFSNKPVQRFVEHLFGIIIILGKPRSRGWLRLQSSDPRAQALIDPAYFEHPSDMQTMVLGIRKARRLAASAGLADWGSRELMPGKRKESDEALANWVRGNAITTYHYAGTCRMGTDRNSCVDTELRLRGVQGVRVADASAVPTTPVSAMNAPSMLVGYRAAQFIKRVRPE